MAPKRMVSVRPAWSNRLQFFVFTSALVLSPFSVWKFPMIWYRNGGVAFVIPYITCLLTVAVPLVCLEISLGQFMQRGGPRAWGVVPLFKGISITSMLLTIIKASTNLSWAAWSMYYLYLILTNQLPNCVIDAVSPLPFSPNLHNDNRSSSQEYEIETMDPSNNISNTGMDFHFFDNLTHMSLGISQDGMTNQNVTCHGLFYHFWREDVLETSDSISSPGSAVIEIFIAAVVVSIILYTLVMRGISWSGKIMYILAPLPLVGFLSIIVWTASSEWNLGRGVSYLLTPNFEKLTHPEPWFECVKITLLSLGVGLNVFPSLASYNQLVNYTIRDSWIVCLLAVSTNVFASLTIFGLLGDFTNSDDADNDPSYLFTYAPVVLMRFRHPLILCSLLFIFIIAIIVGTTVVYIESLVTSIVDMSVQLRRWRLPIVTGTMGMCFLLAIPMSTQGGLYIFRVLERVTDGGFLVISICILECLVIGVAYDGSRFYDNLEMMTGKRPHWWMKFCWTWLSPLILLATLIYEEFSYPLYIIELGAGHQNYDVAKLLLILLVTLLLLPILITAIWIVYSKNGTCTKKIQSSLRPDLKPHQVPIRWRLEGHWHKFTNRL